jgi:hypothetical protein
MARRQAYSGMKASVSGVHYLLWYFESFVWMIGYVEISNPKSRIALSLGTPCMNECAWASVASHTLCWVESTEVCSRREW